MSAQVSRQVGTSAMTWTYADTPAMAMTMDFLSAPKVRSGSPRLACGGTPGSGWSELHKELTVYPSAYPHDPISSLFDDVFLVHGSIRIGPGMRMNRNMLIVRSGDELTLINPVRLNDAALSQLDALGNVRHVMRLGDFHGLDDRFYVDRYQAEIWCQARPQTYKEPVANHVISATATAPMPNAQFFVYEAARFPEACLLLKDRQLLITTDSIQYWADWSYTTFLTRCALRLMGFKLTLLIGGPWLKRVTPQGGSLRPDFERLLALDFKHVVGAHGRLLRDAAKPMLESAIAKSFVG